MSEVVFRRLSDGEIEPFTSFPHEPHAEIGREAKQDYPAHLAEGRCRPEWTWVAVRDGRTIARAAFWGRPGDATPMTLDWFELGDAPDRVAVGAELLRAAYAKTFTDRGTGPEFQLVLPPDWRERADIREEAQARIDAAEQAGLVSFVERFGYTWEPGDGVPERGTRLTYRTGDDPAFLSAITESLSGTFDAHSRDEIADGGMAYAAKESMDFLLALPAGRDWWRLAYDSAGELVGAIFPTRTASGASIGYIAVMPAHRGKGYVNELLAEMVHIHVGNGADRITGNTDMANFPMAKAFNRAGFRTTSAQIDFRLPAPGGVTYRALSIEDGDLFGTYPHPPYVGIGVEHRASHLVTLASGHRRPEWMWVAVRDSQVIARLSFWGFPSDTEPKCVDWFELGEGPDRVAVGAGLMRAAYAKIHGGDGPRPEYILFTPPDWRTNDAARGEVDDRISAAEAAGLAIFVERHGFRWETGCYLPNRSARLEFREADDDAFIAATRDSYPGTLDAYTHEDSDRIGAQATAEQEVGGLAAYPKGREWWRLAYDSAGELVGAIFPAHNADNPVIGYIAVMPVHRGKGYVNDLLAEMMHILIDNGAERIGANTDLANLPMKAAFDRAGFATNGGRIDFR